MVKRAQVAQGMEIFLFHDMTTMKYFQNWRRVLRPRSTFQISFLLINGYLTTTTIYLKNSKMNGLSRK